MVSGRDIVGAAQRADIGKLKGMLKQGADLNVSWRNYRPLHALIQENPHEAGGRPSSERLKCLRWLLDHGADPELTGAWPAARVIIVAAFTGVEEYVAILRAKDARVDGFVHAALGDVSAIRKRLKSSAAFATARDGDDGLTALQCACGSRLISAKALETARALIAAGADVGTKTRSWGHDVDAVYFAASAKRLDVFELLLDSGYDASQALTPALWNANVEYAEVALRHGANPDKAIADSQPLLNNLIRWGQFKPATWLLEHGASPNVADERGWTAVHQAASRGNERMLAQVIEHGGDARRKDSEGMSPIDIARARGREKLVALMRG